MNSPLQNKVGWFFQVVAAIIMGQTLFFKFSGAEETIYIFTTLGAEPYGRWFAGVSEVIAVVLLLWPAMSGLGALLGIGIMSGALLAHLTTKLGIEVQGDGGLLFILGVTVWISCAIVAYIRREQIKSQIKAVKGRFLPA